jgi:hypothetical protein
MSSAVLNHGGKEFFDQREMSKNIDVESSWDASGIRFSPEIRLKEKTYEVISSRVRSTISFPFTTPALFTSIVGLPTCSPFKSIRDYTAVERMARQT